MNTASPLSLFDLSPEPPAMSRRTLDAADLNLILRSLSDAMMTELGRVSWNQSDDSRDAERAEIRDRYGETSAKVCDLLTADLTAVA